MKSRWADDEEDAAAEAARKREKEEKKRAKAEKQRKVDEAAAQALKAQQQQALADSESTRIEQTELSNRPLKRRKLSPEREAGEEKDLGAGGGVKLLRFPTDGWSKCRSVEDYEKLNDIEEGAYGWVSRARDFATGQVTGLREIQTLMDCEHMNIVRLREVVVGEDRSKIEKYVPASFPLFIKW